MANGDSFVGRGYRAIKNRAQEGYQTAKKYAGEAKDLAEGMTGVSEVRKIKKDLQDAVKGNK